MRTLCFWLLVCVNLRCFLLFFSEYLGFMIEILRPEGRLLSVMWSYRITYGMEFFHLTIYRLDYHKIVLKYTVNMIRMKTISNILNKILQYLDWWWSNVKKRSIFKILTSMPNSKQESKDFFQELWEQSSFPLTFFQHFWNKEWYPALFEHRWRKKTIPAFPWKQQWILP